tara:strand:- start:247 stop:615 length:369 start_codon:yes stop_codon:yes gene_type:complete
MIRIEGLDRQSTEMHHALVRLLIDNAERGWFGQHLRTFDIPGRTKMHKDFGYWGYGQARSTDQDERNNIRNNHVNVILAYSTVEQWVNAFLSSYRIGDFSSLFTQALDAKDKISFRIEVAEA